MKKSQFLMALSGTFLVASMVVQDVSAGQEVSSGFDRTACPSLSESDRKWPHTWCALFDAAAKRPRLFDLLFYGRYDASEKDKKDMRAKILKSRASLLKPVADLKLPFYNLPSVKKGACLTVRSKNLVTRDYNFPEAADLAGKTPMRAFRITSTTEKAEGLSLSTDAFINAHKGAVKNPKPGASPLPLYVIGCAKTRKEADSLIRNVYEMEKQVAIVQTENWLAVDTILKGAYKP